MFRALSSVNSRLRLSFSVAVSSAFCSPSYEVSILACKLYGQVCCSKPIAIRTQFETTISRMIALEMSLNRLIKLTFTAVAAGGMLSSHDATRAPPSPDICNDGSVIAYCCSNFPNTESLIHSRPMCHHHASQTARCTCGPHFRGFTSTTACQCI
jgi:hypothetical protein